MKKSPPFSKVAILGLGQIGGSLAWALKKFHAVDKILAYNRKAFPRRHALKKGLVDQAHAQLGPWLKEADLIVLCLPIRVIIEVLPRLKKWVRPSCLIIDVGSTKAEILKVAKRYKISQFVGSHPMAGNEIEGILGAKADLFFGRVWFVLNNEHPHGKKLITLLKVLGADVHLTNASAHDQMVAFLSHLPHAVAYSLVYVVSKVQQGRLFPYAGSSFRDFTRVAASSPKMWQDIFLTNREPILDSIDLMIGRLQFLKSLLRKKNASALLKFFQLGSRLRRKL